MIITLILFSSILPLVNYLGLETYLVALFLLPPYIYMWITAVLVTGRIVYALYRFVPMIRRIIRRSENFLNRYENFPRKAMPSLGKRKFSTSSIVNRLDSGTGKTVIGKAKPSKAQRLSRAKLIHSLRNMKSKFRFVLLNSKFANVVFSRNGGQSLINIFKSISKISGLSIRPGIIRAILHSVRRFNYIARTNGIKGLTLYLKTCSVSLQQSLGEHKVLDSFDIGKVRVSRTSTGLPRLIPALHRARIRSGDTRIIRFYLSLFNAYRVLEYPGRLKLNTITDPFKGTGSISLEGYFVPFIDNLSRLTKRDDITWLEWVIQRMENLKLFNIFKSSSSTSRIADSQFSTHPLAVVAGAAAFANDTFSGSKAHPTYPREDGKEEYTSRLEIAVSHLLGYINPRIMQAFLWFKDNIPQHVNVNPRLLYVAEGKLAPKFEAAGKIRIFAMVDSWTNWFMKPIHDLMFDQILPRIPQDGTFDQLAPVKRLLNSNSFTGLYSLDLSAATDRLPATLQKSLLEQILNKDLASAWKGLMVDRAFAMTAKGLPQVEGLRYAVGQPMGALSSWAMLAITHHFIVQCAAWRSGKTRLDQWYTNYAVLGDDLVLGDKEVVKHYLKILASLGVECGLAKSLLSPKGIALEFAKRTFYKGQDVSPIPFKEIAAASLSFPASLDFAKKYNLSLAKLLSAYGYGFRVLGTLNKPLGNLSAKVRTFILQLHASTLNVNNLMDFLKLGSTSRPRYVYSDWAMQMAFITNEVIPLHNRLRGLITELAPHMNTRKIVANTMEDLYKYYEGMDIPLPKSTVLRDHLHSVVGATKVGPNALVKRTVMDLLSRTEFLINLQKLRVPFGNFMDLYFDVLYIREDIENLPLNDVRFARIKADEGFNLKDSVIPYHVRMWAKYAPYVQGTKELPKLPTDLIPMDRLRHLNSKFNLEFMK